MSPFQSVEVGHSDSSSVLAELPSDLPKELSLVLAARQGQQHLVEALLANRVDVTRADSRDCWLSSCVCDVIIYWGGCQNCWFIVGIHFLMNGTPNKLHFPLLQCLGRTHSGESNLQAWSWLKITLVFPKDILDINNSLLIH